MTPLSHEELLRYSRHLTLPDVGLDGQAKLGDARVLLIGAGGLGSPAALYLAAAGVGTLGLVDFDLVDRSNLQRQIIHGTSAIGTPKIESARARLRDVNPHVQVETFGERLTSGNALQILRGFDIVVDGSDNFPTRYLVNDACVLLGKPNVYGAVFRFHGHLFVAGPQGIVEYDANAAPVRRFRPGLELPPVGVVSVGVGVLGTASEPELLVGTAGEGLLVFDGRRMQFRELTLQKDPDCPVCGAHPTVTELIDYEAFCGVGAEGHGTGDEVEITALELRRERDRKPDLVLLDVREPREADIAHIDGARNIPLRELPGRLAELSGHGEIVTLCHHGPRSLKAREILRGAGFANVRSLAGGIDAWAREVDPEVPRY